jgi:lipooligosaccharide transport system permease protein
MSTPAAVRVWESHFRLYRTIWKSNVMGAFFQPLLYLLGMGLGVGALVDRGSDSAQLLDGLTYFQFLAPSLIATSAMMITSAEAMWPVLGGFRSPAASPCGRRRRR